MNNLFYNRNFFKLIFFFSVIIGSIVLATKLPRVSVPLIVSYVLAQVIRPVLPIFTKIGVNRTLSYILVLTIMGLFVVIPIINLAPKIREEINKFQEYVPKLEVFIQKNHSKLKVSLKEKFNYELGDDVLQGGIKFVESSAKDFILKLPNLLANLLEWILLIPLYLFFFLRDNKTFKNGLLRIVPNSLFERIYYVIHHFNKKFGDYIFAKFIEASIVGSIILIGLLFLGVKFSFLLGLAAAVTNVVPYVGPIIGMIPGVIVCLIEYGPGTTLGAVVTLYLVANIIDVGLVFPILVSKVVDLHPVTVVISVLIGSQYLGIMGMIISIPLAAVFKLVFLELYKALYPVLAKQRH